MKNNNFQLLNQSGNTPHGHGIYFLYIDNVTSYFFENFLCMLIRDTDLSLSFLVVSLSGFGIGVMLAA